MADDTGPADPARPNGEPPALAFGRVIVVGGGCYGSYYVRQLSRARARGAVRIGEVIVVDRDPRCAVALAIAEAGPTAPADTPTGPLRFVRAEWSEYLAELLSAPIGADDAIVPSPLMPHLFLHWLRERAIERARTEAAAEAATGAMPRPRAVTIELPDEVAGVPWQRAGTDGSRYVSFAEWMCPVNCIEPRICPHTKGVRDWDMSRTAAAAGGVDAAAVLHCTHRAYGVGMVDLQALLDADATIAAATVQRAARVLVGTVSNCHGALGVLHVGGSPVAPSG